MRYIITSLSVLTPCRSGQVANHPGSCVRHRSRSGRSCRCNRGPLPRQNTRVAPQRGSARCCWNSPTQRSPEIRNYAEHMTSLNIVWLAARLNYCCLMCYYLVSYILVLETCLMWLVDISYRWHGQFLVQTDVDFIQSRCAEHEEGGKHKQLKNKAMLTLIIMQYVNIWQHTALALYRRFNMRAPAL